MKTLAWIVLAVMWTATPLVIGAFCMVVILAVPVAWVIELHDWAVRTVKEE